MVLFSFSSNIYWLLDQKAVLFLALWWTSAPFPKDFPGGSEDKESTHSARDPGSIPGSRRSPIEGKWSDFTQLCPTLWDPVDCSPPGSSIHGIPQKEYWSGLPFPSPGHFPDPGIEPRSPTLQADALTSEPPGKPWKWLPKSEFLPGESHGQRSLAGYSPWGCKKSDTTEAT